MRLALLALLVAACDDGECIDGLCPDLANAELHPGPCRSAADRGAYTENCEYTYSDGRVTDVRCNWYATGLERTIWTYDTAGQPLSIVASHTEDDAAYNRRFSWTFGATTVTTMSDPPLSKYARTYDRTMIEFLPAPGSFVRDPQAELGLAAVAGVACTWSSQGAMLSRRGCAALGDFMLDDRGRIVWSLTESSMTEYAFDGDRLIAVDRSGAETYHDRFTYDAGGNVATWSTSPHVEREVYDYSCW